MPGTAGFVSKWYLVTAALDEGPLGIGLIAVVVAGSLMAVVYIWRIVEAAWFAAPADEAAAGQPGEAPLMMLTVTWAIALANVAFGLFTEVPRELATRAAGALLGYLP